MKLEDQVLSIEQVQELQELGFDVEKNASVRWCDCSVCKRTYAPCFSYNELRVDKKECPLTREVPTLTIGDIIKILPKEIEEQVLHIFAFGETWSVGWEDIQYYGSNTLIDALFETLKSCIKQKHIAL